MRPWGWSRQDGLTVVACALSGARRPPIFTRPAGALLPGPSGAALGLHPGDRREETGPLQTDRNTWTCCSGGSGRLFKRPLCPSLRLELLWKGLHFLLDPAFYQQLEAAAGVWKVIADEDLLAGLPGWKRETTGTRVTPRLPTVEKGLGKAGFSRAKKALIPTTSRATAAKQTSCQSLPSSGRAVLSHGARTR